LKRVRFRDKISKTTGPEPKPFRMWILINTSMRERN
jgi:hypothetical protein